MKKNMVRVLAFVLVLILALGILPLGALAAGDTSAWVYSDYYAKQNPKLWDESLNAEYDSTGNRIDPYVREYLEGQTIKASDYNQTKIYEGKLYDFNGFSDNTAIYKAVDEFFKNNLPEDAGSWTPEDWDKFDKKVEAFYTNTPYTYIKSDIKIEAYPKEPTTTDAKAWEDYNNAVNAWMRKYSAIFANYTPHQHSLSYWYYDGTTHWRECLVCKKFAKQGFWEQFMYQNWHSDGDEDRICDVCGGDIPYHEIDVEEVKGGKISVELEEAPHRKKIVANVEPEEGYKLKKIHFIKVRTDGTEQEITRRKTTKTSWWTYMPTYDLKVTAEFVKK